MSTPETSEDEAEMEAEMMAVDAMFPDAQFSVCIHIDELDTVITTEPVIMIKNTFQCYCYDDYPKKPEWFSIRGESLTNKFILHELIRQGLKLECNHHFVEFFHKISDCQYEIATGS